MYEVVVSFCFCFLFLFDPPARGEIVTKHILSFFYYYFYWKLGRHLGCEIEDFLSKHIFVSSAATIRRRCHTVLPSFLPTR